MQMQPPARAARRGEEGMTDTNMPRVAYVLLWYPLFTQPFIFREVEGLKREMPLTVYALYGENRRQWSAEMRAAARETRSHGIAALGGILGACWRQLRQNPARLWRLFRRTMFRRWPSLEICGENLWAFLAGVRLAEEFRRDGITHIHGPWPRGTATAAWVASSLTGIPFSTAARGDNLNPADPDLLDKLGAASFIRANNAADVERMVAMLPEGEHARARMRLVYNSLTLCVEGQCPVVMGRPVRLLALGRFDVTKGFDYLMDACRILRDRGFDFHLTLAGGGGVGMGLGQMGAEIERRRRECGLEEHVSLPGLLTHNELPGYLMGHDIFVAPCIVHDSGRRDGIPNTVIEAMAYGMPVVATNINALPEIVRDGETGRAVPQKDAAALADAIMELAAHPDEARRMGAAARALVLEMFDPRANVRRLRDIYCQEAQAHGLRR